jgi:hypothetical protein
MLGAFTGLMYDGSNEPFVDSPTSIGGLIGWWDFTDASSMYTDAGSTNVSSNDDLIYRIDNKAYTKQNNTTLALGKYLEQSTAWKPLTLINNICSGWEDTIKIVLVCFVHFRLSKQ